MLDAYIIEEIKRREDERLRREEQRPVLEIPLYPPEADQIPANKDEPTPERGVIVIDYSI